MSKLDDLQTLVRLLKEFEFPVSPILEYAIKEKEDELYAKNSLIVEEEKKHNNYDIKEPFYFTSLKDEFSKHLFKTKSEATARIYLHYLEKHVRRFINEVIDPNADSIYSSKTALEVRTILLKLKEDDSFVANNSKVHNSLTAAISSYLKFLENKENL